MRTKNKESLPFWRLYSSMEELKVLIKKENYTVLWVNAVSKKARAGVSLNTGLYPWPGTGVLKMYFVNLLGVCEINTIFS